jgi:4-azaleucine resistance transporter AzlC
MMACAVIKLSCNAGEGILIYWAELRGGAKKAFSIVLGYLPLGFAYGALANLAGLELPLIVVMSLLVFAGSAQFIAVNMLEGGAAGAAVIATVFIVNLRHLLMSASLAPHLQTYPRRVLPLLAFWLTDENYALACGEFRRYERSYLFIIGLFGTAYAGWVLGGALGGLLGHFFDGRDAALTMGYALYAMFIFLIVIQATEKRLLLAASISGLLAVIFYLSVPGSWYIILATACTATLGVLTEKWQKIS